MAQKKIQVLPNPPLVAREAAELMVSAARLAQSQKPAFSVALSGGSTPKALFELLAGPAYRSQIDWARVEVFFGDERCVPPDSDQSNYRMAREALFSKVPLPGGNIYRMRGEIDPQEAATEYGGMLKEKFGDGGLDLIFLGMGPDGHTASLFPGTEALNEREHRCVANYVEKLKAWRITLTAPFINRARQAAVLVTGADKAVRLAEVLEGPRQPETLPIQLIEPAEGSLIWLVDAAAAGMQV